MKKFLLILASVGLFALMSVVPAQANGCVSGDVHDPTSHWCVGLRVDSLVQGGTMYYKYTVKLYTSPPDTRNSCYANIYWVPGNLWGPGTTNYSCTGAEFSTGYLSDLSAHDFYWWVFQSDYPGQTVPGSNMAGYFG